MKKIIYLLLLLSKMAGQSQSFQWLKTPPVTAGFNWDLVGYPLTVSAAGNVYVCGFSDTPTPYIDVMGNLFFNKYNAQGDLLFSKAISGKANVYSVATDSQDNVLLALTYLNTITIGSTTLSTVEQGVHPLIAKFDAQGNLLWYHALTADAPQGIYVDDVRAVTFDAQDNAYVAYNNYSDSYIAKYSPSGTPLLTIQQQSVRRITSLAIDDAGNIYAAGSCAEPDAAFAGTPAPTALKYNTYISKYNSTGQFQWVRFAEDITCPNPQVAVHGTNDVYFASALFGANQFGSISTEGPNQSSDDFFLAKLDGAGTYQWVQEIPGPGEVELGKRQYLAVDGAGNAYIAGSVRWNANWGNGVTASGTGNTPDAFVIKFSTNGQPLFAKTATGDAYDRFDGVAIGSTGDIYLSGMAAGSTHFDALEHPVGNFDYYPFVVKLSNNTLKAPSVESPVVYAYPNPASSQLHLQGIETGTPVTVYNMLGQPVLQTHLPPPGTIDLSGMSTGAYLLKAGSHKPFRIIKQ